MKGFHLNIVKVFLLLVFAQVTVAQTDFDLSVTPVGNPVVFPSGGGMHTLTYTVSNPSTGQDEADQLIVSFFYDFSVSPVSTTSPDVQWNCAEVTQQIDCTYQGPFNAGVTSTIDLSITAPGNDVVIPGAIAASLFNALGDPNPANNSINTDINFTSGGVDLGLVKTIASGFPNTVSPGDPINFDLTVTNLSGSDANNVLIMDDIMVNGLQFDAVNSSQECDDVGSFVACNLAVLAAGDSITLTIATTVDVLTLPGNRTNTATVSADEPDPDSSNNSSDRPFAVGLGLGPEVELTKTIFGGLTQVIQGGMIDYVIEVNNTGVGDAVNVDLTDILPVGVTYVSHVVLGPNFNCTYVAPTVSCNAPTLPNTASQDGVRISVLVDGAINLAVTNTVTSTFLDSNLLDNTAVVLFNIIGANADLELTMVADQSNYTVGDLITLDLTLNNPVTSTGAPPNATVITTLPVETVFNSAQVSNVAGWSCVHDGATTGGDVTCNSQGTPVAIGTNVFIEIIAVANSTTVSIVSPPATVTSDFDSNPANDTASAFFEIFPGNADLSIQMTSSAGVYTESDSIIYAIQVNNPMGSPSSPSDVTVDINLPAEVGFVNADVSSAPGWVCAHDGALSGGVVVCDRGGAPFNQFSTHDFNIEVLAQTATINALLQANINSAADANLVNNSTNQSDVINAGISDFSISKTVSGADFAVGDAFTYVLSIDNPISSTANPVDVAINDQLPAEVSYVSYLVGTNLGTTINCTHDGSTTGGLFSCDTNGTFFAAGETATIDINVTAATISGNVDNSATVETATDADGTTNNNNDNAMTVAISGPLVTTVTATKTAAVAGVPVTQVNYGQTFEYVLEVQNTGTIDAQNIVVTDTLPAEVSLVGTQSIGWTCGSTKVAPVKGVGSDIDCNLDSPLTPSSTAQIVVDVIATSNTSIVSILNTMEVNGANIGAEVTTNVTVTLQNSMASLNLSQNPSPVDPNADVEFSLLAANTGITGLNGLQIDSQLPTGFTYNGFSGDAPWNCTANAGTVSCAYAGTLLSSANTTVNLQTTAPTPQVNQTYALNATLSANELSNDLIQNITVAFSTSDILVNLTSVPQQAALGEPFKHVLQINNSGNFDLVNVTAYYAAPETATLLAVTGSDFNCSTNLNIITCINFQPLVAGNSTQIEFGLRVDDSLGLIGSSVSVNADGIIKSTSTTTQIMNNLQNDLSLTKTASASQVGQNEAFAYQFDVINLGSETQTAFSLTDQLPAGVVFQSATGNNWSCDGNNPLTCQFNGSLATGGQTQLSIEVIAPNEIGVLTNTATINLTQDENASNDASSIAIDVVEGGGGGLARADLAVLVEANNPGVLNTEQVSWRIEVSNAGPDQADNVIVSNTLPMGFVAGSVQVGNGTECTLLETSLTCEIATLAVNQNIEITLEGGFISGFSGLVINTVEVQSDAIDNNPSNNSSTGEVTVSEVLNLNADLALELNASNQQVQQGGMIDLSFTAKNMGPDRGVNSKIIGNLSGLIQNVQLLNTGGWMCQANSSGISCVYPGDFQLGMQSEISLRVQTQQVVQQSQPILFNASIESDSMDSQPANNIIGFTNEVTRTPTEDEIFAIFQNAVGSAASETVIQSIRNVSSYCARSYFMAIEGLCEEFIAGATPENGGAIINAMEELTPNEVAAQSNSASEIITSQFRNVDSRLAQLRGGGGSGLSVAGLSGRYGNESIPIGMLSYLNQSEDEQAVSNINDFVSPWGFFVNGSISMGERDATGQELGFDFDTVGLTAGVDYRFSSTKVAGVALGYANFDSEIEGEAEMKSTGFTLTGYGSFYIKDNFYVDARISYGNPDFEQKRRINFAVDEIVIDRVATSKTNSDQYSVAMSAGYHFNKNSWNITPNASLRYVRTTIDAFQESGAGGFNFAFGEQEVKSMVWSIGTSVSKAISLKNGIISPQFDINLSRETENDGGLLEARFISAPDDEIFWIGTDEPDRTYGSAGVGLVFIGANGKQAYINYRSIFGLEGFTRGTINVGARFEF